MTGNASETTGSAGAQTAAPAGTNTQTPQAPTPAAAAPDKGGQRDAWDRMGVSLDDLPVVEGGNEEGEATAEGNTNEDGGEPAKPEAKPDTGSELTTKAGRVFKTPTELLTAYENSSNEGVRLAAEIKTIKAAHEALNGQLQEANKALMELQEYVSTTGTFPGAKTPDEVAAMTEEERYNYYSDKRAWEAKRTEYSNRISNAKKAAEEYAKNVRSIIDRTEREMAADTAAYPGFTDMAELRGEILKNSPHLDNKPDTPYVTYFIAKGLLAGREAAEKARLEAESQQKAKADAEAASRQAGGGAPSAGGKPAPKENTGLDRTVAAFKRRRGGF